MLFILLHVFFNRKPSRTVSLSQREICMPPAAWASLHIPNLNAPQKVRFEPCFPAYLGRYGTHFSWIAKDP